MINIAIDAMGGDNAPECNVLGALQALENSSDITLYLVGQGEKIRPYLDGRLYDHDRLFIKEASEVIETGEPPVMAIQTKKDSSLVVGLKMLKDGSADAFVSAGSTGAVLVGGQVIAGRLKGVKRAALAVKLPTLNGTSVLIDCGANVDARPENLNQFAVIGSVYSKYILNNSDPSVGLINIGAEEEKGNQLCRDTYPVLKDNPEIRFIGNAEARDIPFGAADVLVCEAFTGNVVLKMYEGVAKALLKEIKTSLMSSFTGKLGGALIRPSLRPLMSKFDSSEDGGAPLLGLKGLVVKAHGNSTSLQIRNAVLQCIGFINNDLSAKIEKAIEKI